MTGEPEAETVVHLEAEARSNVQRVFATLKTSFPAWYEKHYGEAHAEKLAKRVWMTGVRLLNNAQVDRGLRRMVLTADFPPSLKEFIRLCCHIDGVPGVQAAWHQALRGTYGHEVVRVAAILTGLYELRRASDDNRMLFDRFELNYVVVTRRLESGEPLDGSVPHAIKHDSQKTGLERSLECAEEQLYQRIVEQGIPLDGSSARQQLLSRMRIRRPEA
ncbi:hypothetical protein LX59_03040 [Azomonas agilis]|uniref:Uncharacterized protein n=2 Tax=Azomonas agilis TaxID=116849 RepID=A0A562HZ47_9GAMM|nr:hypothetical protein LX59_03040 [Azomonas agilis]